MKKLSIITINLNNRQGLQRTIDSVCRQTCRDFEWIIIDGGSTDGSLDLIRRHADNISVWVSEPDGGIYEAMNKGIEMSSGLYLNFLNSGDYYESDEVVKMFLAEDCSEDVVYGDVRHVESSGNTVRIVRSPDRVTLGFFHEKNIYQQSMFYNRDCFRNLRFATDLRLCSDYEMNMRLYLAKRSFRHLPMIVARYDVEGLSSTNLALGAKEMEMCRRRVIPDDLYGEYKRLLWFANTDIGAKSLYITEGPRFGRNMMRAFLLPLHKILSLCRKD